MKQRSLYFFVIPSILVLVTLLFTGCDEFLREEKEFSLKITPERREFSTLTIDSRNGYINVEPWDNNYILLEGKKYIQGMGDLKRELEKVEIKYKEIGVSFRIFIEYPTNNNQLLSGRSYGANMEIRVPYEIFNALTSLDMDTSNGSIALNQFKGNIIADTSNSSIDFIDCTGDLRVKSSNGSITLQNINGQIEADTSNASIKIKDCFLTGPYNTFSTSNGSITGNLVLPLSGTSRLKTSNGRIELNIPANSKFEFSARTSNSSVSIKNLNMILSHDEKTSKKGTVNGGDTFLDLSSSNGSIKLTGE